uniref:Uncharacterized protein n=1 Tax=Cyprinus carpio carpio TaxID=630221 RepID=A0A8C0Y9L3_CYPCA
MQRVSLDFTGTIFPHAICLGDAENDSTETGAVSLSLATRTGWCGRSGGRNLLMLQI